MNQDNFPRSDWYAAPVMRSAPRPQPQPAPRKKHTGVRVAAITAVVLLLLVASVYAFSDSFGLHWSFREYSGDGTDHGFSFEIPGGKNDAEETPSLPRSPFLPDAPDTEDDYDRDYRDYFSRYYSAYEIPKTESSAIARAETGDSFRMTLQSAAGLPELTLQELYSACADTIVGIRATTKGRSGYFWGTGIIMSEDGLILTNQHIIAGTDAAVVILPDGREADALLVGEDAQMDIAVLKVEAAGLHAAQFGNSAALSVGDSVVAIGNPLTDSLSGTMTNGIISAIDRNVSSNGHTMTLLQTNAALNEGNSGGPLFNMYGQVVGITNMKMVNTYSDVTVEGIGFAIPSATAKAVTDQLIAGGSYVRPGLGITVGAIDRADAAHYDLPDGLYISAVSPQSDAAAKGVQVGDILTHVNGVPVRKTDEVLAIRDTLQVGDSMTLTIYRDGETMEIEIELFDLGKLY